MARSAAVPPSRAPGCWRSSPPGPARSGERPLIGETSGKASRWLQFKEITNQTWCHGTVVLLGDAAHTTHFTMGFGTRLAMIDAAVLAQCLLENPLDLGAGLGHYERVRRPALAQIQAGGRTSMAWFENVEH
jgi:2-polyprenyl-6-methoxyphenol hydroxylase-like FAD-dependent oxidoreductase